MRVRSAVPAGRHYPVQERRGRRARPRLPLMPQFQIRKYVPDGKVLTQFFKSRGEKDIIQGPIGSGTSTCCCHRIFATALQQAPGRDLVRRSRWLIVRNTFNELQETTVKTWLDWFPEQVFGDLRRTRPFMQLIEMPLPDGTFLHLQVIFLALDQEDDIKKLASLEVTGIWFNEVQFIDKPIVDEGHSRCGRFPPPKEGTPATWKGIIADMNAPKEGHWVPYMRGDVPLPAEWNEDKREEFRNVERKTSRGKPIPPYRFFVQPPALIEVKDEDGIVRSYDLNPKAENQKWLLEGFYETLWPGKPKDWIDERLMNRVGLYRVGQAVYPQFVPELHILKQDMPADPDFPLVVGVDFGRMPAAIIAQEIRGRWFFLSEVIGENVGAEMFAPRVRRHLLETYPENVKAIRTDHGEQLIGVRFFGDPSADRGGEASEVTAFRVWARNGMPVMKAPCPNNEQTLRKGAMNKVLTEIIDGKPRMNVSPRCTTFKTGMNGGYHYAKVQGSAGRWHETPTKDRYSHVCEAAEYALLGGGEGTALLAGGQMPAVVEMQRERFRFRGRRR